MKENFPTKQKGLSRDDILKSALAVILENNTPSTRKIAARAGTSVSTVYHYFKNAEELMLMLGPHIDKKEHQIAYIKNCLSIEVKPNLDMNEEELMHLIFEAVMSRKFGELE